MAKIRKGDEVLVMAGKDKGKRGHVLQVKPDSRLVVEGVNLVKRHTKPNPRTGASGGIVDREKPIHISNVRLYNTATGKGERAGFRFLQDGRKVRYFKSTGEVVDV
ncbi:MAG: 50S ribosomal protein L24 [Gammaproteobacteria bacterium]